MSDKLRYAGTIQNKANIIVQLQADCKAIFETYFDRGYNVGGAAPITDEDLATLGLTAADVSGFITFAENFGKMLDNQAVFQSDYSQTMNKIRSDI